MEFALPGPSARGLPDRARPAGARADLAAGQKAPV